MSDPTTPMARSGTRDPVARVVSSAALIVAIVAILDPCTPPEQPHPEKVEQPPEDESQPIVGATDDPRNLGH
jgi:hypothetical protein